MKLYDYYRSTAAYRVRIALNLKGLTYEQVPVNLLDGEQRSAEFGDINPQRLVPVLATKAGMLSQSLAIIEYLDEVQSERPLLPKDAWQRAKQRAMADVIACDVHPINNLRVLNYLRGPLQQPENSVQQWISHWMTLGFSALEQSASDAPFLGGDQPMLPDVVLVPQIYNARRFNVSMEKFPKLVGISDRCREIDEFARARPE